MNSTCMNNRNQSSNEIERKLFTFSDFAAFLVSVSRPSENQFVIIPILIAPNAK